MSSASVIAPLCPTCLERVLAWTAASCPQCKKSSPVAACDRCGKSRAGAFAPEDAKMDAASGGAQRFLCVDCMEELLEADASDRMRDAVLAVALVVAAVRFDVNQWITIVLFAATALCLFLWIVAARRKKRPAAATAALWKFFRRRIEKAVAQRPGSR